MRGASFGHRQPGLVWSNANADAAAFIRAALVRPRFHQLLQIALEVGWERLQSEWSELCSDPTPEVRRADPIVTRILRNIREGFSVAACARTKTRFGARC